MHETYFDHCSPGLVVLGVVVLIVVLLVKAFSGHGGIATKQVDVGKYADTAATATLLVDGPTNIDQAHQQVKITVSQTSNEIDIIQGYEGTVTQTRTYPNNSVAFGVFLQALKLKNFAKGNDDKSLTDYRGYCPTGERYIYTFNDGQKDVFQYWSTSCNQGTFKGNALGVLALFQQQIPQTDFNKLTNPIPLGF
ncbi:MAG: hypothetical protein WDN27_04365 [Candidatus Saccharibacteria bacterium]